MAKGPRAIPAGLADTMTKGEQAHIDSQGAEPIASAGGDTAAGDTGADTLAAGGDTTADTGQDTVRGGEGADSVDAGGTTDDRRTVPHAALHQEREENKRLRADMAKLQERTNAVLEAFTRGQIAPVQPAAPVAPEAPKLVEVPAFEADPAAHIRATQHNHNVMLQQQQEALGQIVQLLTGQHQQTEQQRQQQSQWNTERNALATSIATFKAATPDFDQAETYLGQVRDQQLKMLHPNPIERQQVIGAEAREITRRALAQGLDPAAVFYQMAIDSGYKKGAATTAATRIATVANGQRRAGPTLATVRGAGPGPLTAQKLLEMDPNEFDAAIKTPQGRALLGH